MCILLKLEEEEFREYEYDFGAIYKSQNATSILVLCDLNGETEEL